MLIARELHTFQNVFQGTQSISSGATKFDFPRYSNLVAGFISNIRRFDFLSRKFEIPSRKFDSTCLSSLENESVFGAIFLPRDSILVPSTQDENRIWFPRGLFHRLPSSSKVFQRLDRSSYHRSPQAD